MTTLFTGSILVGIDLEAFDGAFGHAFEAWASVDVLNVEGGIFLIELNHVWFDRWSWGFAKRDSFDDRVVLRHFDGHDVIEGVHQIEPVVFLIEAHGNDEVFLAKRVGMEKERE